MGYKSNRISAIAFAIALGGSHIPQAFAVVGSDGCGDSQYPDYGFVDIDTLTATFVEHEAPEDDEVVVEMLLCDVPDHESVKYRVRFEYEEPVDEEEGFEEEPVDEEEDLELVGDVECPKTSDAGMMFKVTDLDPVAGTSHGPGTIEPGGQNFIFRVPIAELDPSLGPGDTVYIKSDIQYRGILDRAPNKVKEKNYEGCNQSFLELELVPEEPEDLIAFVTSEHYSGDLVSEAAELGYIGTDGIDAGDFICQHHAEIASLTGNYGAWLSTGSSDAMDPDRFGSSSADGPIVRTDGVMIADSLDEIIVQTGPAVSINVTEIETELNSRVWTGTDPLGMFVDGATCGEWNTDASFGWFGQSDNNTNTDFWTSDFGANCVDQYPLYCFQK